MVCNNCGYQMKEDALFCGKCGTKPVKESACFACGAILEPDCPFCTKCGEKQPGGAPVQPAPQQQYSPLQSLVRPATPHQPPPPPPNSVPPQRQYTPPPAYQNNASPPSDYSDERELFLNKLCSYKPTFIQDISGTFKITNKRIHFKPFAIHFLMSEVTIHMSDVARAEKGGLGGLGVSVFTKSGKKYLFMTGLMESPARVVDIINQNKC